jgi:hypothetical protein
LVALACAALFLAGCVTESNPNDTANQGENHNRHRVYLGQSFDGGGHLGVSADFHDNWSFRTEGGQASLSGFVPAHSSMIYYVWTCKSFGADANNMPQCNTWNLAYSGAADNPNGTTNLLWAMPGTVTADVRTIAGCFVYVWDGCNPNYQPVAFLRVEFISSYNMDYSFRFTVN